MAQQEDDSRTMILEQISGMSVITELPLDLSLVILLVGGRRRGRRATLMSSERNGSARYVLYRSSWEEFADVDAHRAISAQEIHDLEENIILLLRPHSAACVG